MKKLYTVITILTLTITIPIKAQRIMDNGSELIDHEPGEVPAYLGSCDTISTLYTSNNFSYGNMFSILATSNIILQSFDGNIRDSGTVKVYYKLGGYSGFEGNASAWTLVDSTYVISNGNDTSTAIPIVLNLEIDSGQVYSFYVTGNNDGAQMNYTDGITEGDTLDFNNDLIIYEGIGLQYPFGATFSPRVWNGTIHYCPNINYCDEITTTYIGGNGNDGVVFEVVTLQDAVIRTFDVNLTDTGYVYIYYRMGPYVGTTTNPSAWILADSALVSTAGFGLPTEVPIDVDLYLPQGQLCSFLITGDGVNQSVNYTNGVAIGASYTNDNTLQIREGEGFSAPWGGGNGSPRVFNGTIHYCTPGEDTAIVCPRLFTTNLRNNGNNGIMFDVEAKNQAIEIENFETYLTTGMQEVRIYYKNGTHIGFETDTSAWTLIDSMNINATAGVLTTIPIPVGLQIAPLSKMAFFIYTNNAMDYSNGNGITVPDTIFVQDSYSIVREGTGKGDLFVTTGPNPRVFNGRINYCTLESWIGIEENISGNGLKLWPNPTDGVFNISLSNTAETIEKIEVINMNGEFILQEMKPSTDIVSIDISGETKGIYLVRLSTTEQVYTRKIILSGE